MSSGPSVNLNYLPTYTVPTSSAGAAQCRLTGKLAHSLVSQSAATFHQPATLTCSNGPITQQNRLHHHQQTLYPSSSDCAQCIGAQTAAYLNECRQQVSSGLDTATSKVWAPDYSIERLRCAPQINPSGLDVEVSRGSKQVSVVETRLEPPFQAAHKQVCSHQSTSSHSSTMHPIPTPQQPPMEMQQDNSAPLNIVHCQGPGCDGCCVSDLDTDSDEQCDSLVFNYEPILGKILNEKKLALSRSAQVIKFFADEAPRPAHPEHPTADQHN